MKRIPFDSDEIRFTTFWPKISVKRISFDSDETRFTTFWSKISVKRISFDSDEIRFTRFWLNLQSAQLSSQHAALISKTVVSLLKSRTVLGHFARIILSVPKLCQTTSPPKPLRLQTTALPINGGLATWGRSPYHHHEVVDERV